MLLFAGEPFAKAIGSYLQKGFQKGVPSLFQSVKYLYAKPEKVSWFDFPSTQISFIFIGSNN